MFNIALEGIDGAGKSTQIKCLEKRLTQEGYPVVVWHYTNKENMWGQLIKDIFSNNENNYKKIFNSRYFQEMLYALSSRASFNQIKSKNELEEKTILLSDRSIISAYASHIGRIPNWFINLAELNISPDIAIYLDLSPEEGIKRISGREICYADENLNELRYFRECYEKVIGEKRPSRLRNTRFIKIGADASQEIVAEEVYKVVKTELVMGGKYGQR